MHGKKNIVAVFVCLVMLCACQRKQISEVPSAEGEFEIVFLKVGKADAMLLSTENQSMMIDCGEEDDGKKILKLLEEKKISEVDYLVLTHFDKDHIGGFSEVAERVAIGCIYVSDYIGNNGAYQAYEKTVKERELSVCVLSEDIRFLMDDVLVEMSASKQKSYEETDNDASIVLSVTHGDNSFLFAGDAEDARMREILNEFGHPYDVLKFPHHGRYHEMTQTFLKTVKPRYTVVCDSRKNPTEEETKKALQEVESKVYHTADGDIRMLSDGKNIEISQ